MVVLEADGTGIRCRDGPAEAKVVIWYAGKRVRRSGTGHRRPEGPAAAQEGLRSRAGGRPLRPDRLLSRRASRGSLGPGSCWESPDGGGWLPGLFAEWMPVDAHQLDHFHGRRRIRETPGLPSETAPRSWSPALEGRLEEIVAEATVLIRRGVLHPRRVTDPWLTPGVSPYDR